MKFTIEFELKNIVINEPNLSEEIIKEAFFNSLKGILSWEASNIESEHPEVYIDVSDNGDGSQYNLYHLKIVE